MDVPKFLACVSVACSSFAILCTILVVPTLYRQINDLHSEIMTDVVSFKVGNLNNI